MSPGETAARQALEDILGICRRDGSIPQRFQAVEDRAHQATRDLDDAAEAAYGEDRTLVPVPDCDCGEAGCARGVCR